MHNPVLVELTPPASGNGPPVGVSIVIVIPAGLLKDIESWVKGFGSSFRFGKVKVKGTIVAAKVAGAMAIMDVASDAVARALQANDFIIKSTLPKIYHGSAPLSTTLQKNPRLLGTTASSAPKTATALRRNFRDQL